MSEYIDHLEQRIAMLEAMYDDVHKKGVPKKHEQSKKGRDSVREIVSQSTADVNDPSQNPLGEPIEESTDIEMDPRDDQYLLAIYHRVHRRCYGWSHHRYSGWPCRGD